MGAATFMKQTAKKKANKVKHTMSEQDAHKKTHPVKEEPKVEPVKTEKAKTPPAVSEGNIKAGIVIS